jgi:hypothetical protein
MKQRDWVKELEEKKKEETVFEYDKNGWFKWYVTGNTSATNDVVYYTDTGTGNYF